MDDGTGVEVGLFSGEKEFWKFLRRVSKAELETDAGRVNLIGLAIIAGVVLILKSGDVIALIVHEIDPGRDAPNDPIQYVVVLAILLIACVYMLEFGRRK